MYFPTVNSPSPPPRVPLLSLFSSPTSLSSSLHFFPRRILYSVCPHNFSNRTDAEFILHTIVGLGSIHLLFSLRNKRQTLENIYKRTQYSRKKQSCNIGSAERFCFFFFHGCNNYKWVSHLYQRLKEVTSDKKRNAI